MKLAKILCWCGIAALVVPADFVLACAEIDPCATKDGSWSFGSIAALTLGAGFAIYMLWSWWDRIDPVLLDRDDPEVIAAKMRAREKIGDFWDAFNFRAERCDNFAIKCELPEPPGGGTESVWLAEISNRSGRLFGRIVNETIHPDFDEGDIMEIDPKSIDDWMYVEDEQLKGHFLTKVMIAKAPKRDAKRMLKVHGWTEADLR